MVVKRVVAKLPKKSPAPNANDEKKDTDQPDAPHVEQSTPSAAPKQPVVDLVETPQQEPSMANNSTASPCHTPKHEPEPEWGWSRWDNSWWGWGWDDGRGNWGSDWGMRPRSETPYSRRSYSTQPSISPSVFDQQLHRASTVDQLTFEERLDQAGDGDKQKVVETDQGTSSVGKTQNAENKPPDIGNESKSTPQTPSVQPTSSQPQAATNKGNTANDQDQKTANMAQQSPTQPPAADDKTPDQKALDAQAKAKQLKKKQEAHARYMRYYRSIRSSRLRFCICLANIFCKICAFIA